MTPKEERQALLNIISKRCKEIITEARETHIYNEVYERRMVELERMFEKCFDLDSPETMHEVDIAGKVLDRYFKDQYI